MLTNAINKTDYLNNDRVIRCIIFLAKGSLSALHTYIHVAITDPRDVMLWAEYETNGHAEPERRYDFSNTFEKN